VSDALDAEKNPIIIDNTFVQPWEREQYMKLVSDASDLSLLLKVICKGISQNL